MKKYLLVVLPLLFLTSGCSSLRTHHGSQLPDYPADPGYFLDLKQKAQLVWHGRVQDSHGGWYNIWICPGYTGPSRDLGAGFSDGIDALGKYADGDRFDDMIDDAGDALEWGYEDCLKDFVIEGTPKSWAKYFKRANGLVEKRVFGWWMAYPWATLQSSVATAFRVPVGLTGTALGLGWGVAAVPAWYLTSPALESGWHVGVRSLAGPAAGYAWNTVVSPPLALVGQKPAPSRVDGLWVRFLNPEDLAYLVQKREKPIDAAEFEKLDSFKAFLKAEFTGYVAARKNIGKTYSEKQKQINEERQKAYTDADKEMQGKLNAWLKEPGNKDAIKFIEELKTGAYRSPKRNQSIWNALIESGAVDENSKHRLQSFLGKAQLPQTATPEALDHTDPVKESIQVIEEIDK